jgi:hypothetical protein
MSCDRFAKPTYFSFLLCLIRSLFAINKFYGRRKREVALEYFILFFNKKDLVVEFSSTLPQFLG